MITEDRIQKLWEWCGARCENCGKLIQVKPVHIKVSCYCASPELDFDLNNLFRFAVPKLKQTLECQSNLNVWFGEAWSTFTDTRYTHCVIKVRESIISDSSVEGKIEDEAATAFFLAAEKLITGV